MNRAFVTAFLKEAGDLEKIARIPSNISGSKRGLISRMVRKGTASVAETGLRVGGSLLPWAAIGVIPAAVLAERAGDGLPVVGPIRGGVGQQP